MKKTKLFIILLNFLLSFLFHNLYEYNQNVLFSIFFPVNESIFEHMKIISSSILVSSLIELFIYKIYNIKYNNFSLSIFLQIILSIVFYLIIFIPFYLVFGEVFLFNIILLFITYFLSNILSYFILNKNDYNSKYISIIFIVLIVILFGIFTYNPIHNFIFIDPITNLYGIK